MTRDYWIGIEAREDGARGWRFDATTVIAEAAGQTVEEVTKLLGDDPVLVVAAGQNEHVVPAPVLSETLPLPDLRQARPAGHLCAVARLRIAGALSARPHWDGVICIAMADVTHWCQISADEVVSFQSALTPELAGSLGAADRADPEALADTLSRPERLSLHLRSATLANAPDAVAGHLLGAEMAAMRPYWLGQQIIVIEKNSLYSAALRQQGVPVDTFDPANCARDGLIALRSRTR